jgi:hypothetical protein
MKEGWVPCSFGDEDIDELRGDEKTWFYTSDDFYCIGDDTEKHYGEVWSIIGCREAAKDRRIFSFRIKA